MQFGSKIRLSLSAVMALALGAVGGVAFADDGASTLEREPLILDMSDLSLDLAHLQRDGVTGLDFAGALPVPEQVQLATLVDFDLGDGGSIPTVTTNASATYVLSPQVATRVSYIRQLRDQAKARNLLQIEAAMNTNCMGKFDLVGQLDADQGEAKFKSLTWHIPRFGAC